MYAYVHWAALSKVSFLVLHPTMNQIKETAFSGGSLAKVSLLAHDSSYILYAIKTKKSILNAVKVSGAVC